MEIEIEVSGVKSVAELLEDGVREGAKGTRDNLLNVAKQEARNVITRRDAIWKGELYRNIHTFETSAYSGKVLADADHAAAIERGADYGAEGPPVVALIPWVKSQMGVGFSKGGYTATPSPSDAGYEEELNFDIAGEKKQEDILYDVDMDVSNAEFVSEDEPLDYEVDIYRGQRLVYWDSTEERYFEGEVTGYNFNGEPEVLAREEWNEFLDSDFESSLDEFQDVVYHQSYDNLSPSEKSILIDNIVNSIDEVKQSDSDYSPKEVFTDAVDKLESSIENEDLREKLTRGLSKVPDVTNEDVPKPVRAGVTLRDGDDGIDVKTPSHVQINTEHYSEGNARGSAIHENHHLVNIFGQPEWRTHHKTAVPGTDINKRGEYQLKSNSGTLVRFEYADGDFSGGKDTGNLPVSDEYGAAWKYFLQNTPDGEGAKDQLNYFGDSVLDSIKSGYLNTPDDKEFSPISATDLFGEGGVLETGDYLYDPPDDKYWIVESVKGSKAVLSSNQGDTYEAELGDAGLDIIPDYDDQSGANTIYGARSIDVAKGDGTVDKSYIDFFEDSEYEQYREGINRAWLRGAIASDEFDVEDVQESYLINGDPYALTGASESSTNLWELFLTEERFNEGSAIDLYQKHPELFWAVNQVLNPSQKFKNELEDKYEVPYEELVERTKP